MDKGEVSRLLQSQDTSVLDLLLTASQEFPKGRGEEVFV